MAYNPRLEITNSILTLVADISMLVGKISATTELNKSPILRKANRIQTIHSSLAIEQNTLTLEQVTAVLNGKTIIAPPKDIEEVKNAYEIYELLDTLNPYSVDDLLKAHSVMMRGLVDEAGAFRSKPVGVFDSQSGEVVHLGTLPAYVPEAIEGLLVWLKESDLHPIIKSCIFHFEFELIHPFLDGNGRIGRFWQTLILSKYNSVFAYLPIESMVYKKQKEYYIAINNSDFDGTSTEFVEFMLTSIKETLEEALSFQSDIQSDTKNVTLKEKEIIDIISKNSSISQKELAKIINVTDRTVKRRMKAMQEKGIIERVDGKQNGFWKILVNIE